MKNLFELFKNARASGIKYPAVAFPHPFLSQSIRVRLYLATKGYIAITVDGEYIGRADKMILPEDALIGTKSFDLRIYQYKELTELLDEIIANPTEELAIQGRKSGSCCFCHRQLDNKISVAMGYGPICAEKYGLPWELPSQSTDSVDVSDL